MDDYLRTKMASVIAEVTEVSLHSADPAETGANEISGGDPAYARVAVASWVPASSPGWYQATLAAPFNLPADSQVVWCVLWNGAQYVTKGSCYASTTVQDTLEITALYFYVPEPS